MKCGPRPWTVSLIWYFPFSGKFLDAHVISLVRKAPCCIATLPFTPPKWLHVIHIYEYLALHITILPKILNPWVRWYVSSPPPKVGSDSPCDIWMDCFHHLYFPWFIPFPAVDFVWKLGKRSNPHNAFAQALTLTIYLWLPVFQVRILQPYVSDFHPENFSEALVHHKV